MFTCLSGVTAGNMFDGIFTRLMRLFKHELFGDLWISQSSSMYLPNEAILVYTWLLDTYLTCIYFLDLTKICPRPLVVTALYFIGYICTENIHATAKKIKTTKQKHWYINFVSNTITSVSHFVIKLRSTAVKDPSICISIKNEFWMVQPNL